MVPVADEVEETEGAALAREAAPAAYGRVPGSGSSRPRIAPVRRIEVEADNIGLHAPPSASRSGSSSGMKQTNRCASVDER